MRDQLPRGLRKGLISRRQPNHWDLVCGRDRWRVSFRGRREARFVAPSFAGATLTANAPVLALHVEARRRLFVTSPATAPDLLIARLEEAVVHASRGFRSLAELANPDASPRSILEQGRGLLLEAPASVLPSLEHALGEAGVEYETRDGRGPGAPALALVLGRNFVVAEHFDFVAGRSG